MYACSCDSAIFSSQASVFPPAFGIPPFKGGFFHLAAKPPEVKSLPQMGKVSAKLTDGMIDVCLLMCLCHFQQSSLRLPPLPSASPLSREDFRTWRPKAAFGEDLPREHNVHHLSLFLLLRDFQPRLCTFPIYIVPHQRHTFPTTPIQKFLKQKVKNQKEIHQHSWWFFTCGHKGLLLLAAR